jgi:dihydrofolate reductase
MRKLIYAINFSADGCCDHAKIGGSESILQHFTHLLQDIDLFIYGRKTYELMVPYWPNIVKNPSGETKAEVDYAEKFDSIEKVVFSHSLEHVEDGNSRLVRTDFRDEILKLKQEPGKNMMTGGVDFPSQLIKLGLVDEFHFVVHPIIAGEGRRLMEGVGLPEKLKLKIVGSNVSEAGGWVVLHYVKQ